MLNTANDRRTSNDVDDPDRAGRDDERPGGADAPGRGTGRRTGLVRRWGKRFAIGLGVLLGLLVTTVAFSSWRTERDIGALRADLVEVAVTRPAPVPDPASVAALPEPVQRYLDFAFVGPQRPVTHVELTASGEFRRPLTEGFAPTTAEQTIAVGTPGLVFSARTTVLPGLWARAYDAYLQGEMEMKAKILSTLTVVDESETPELNRSSLQRWLLESPLYPAALLPGGPVRWEAIDDTRARAVVAADGLEASLVATFRPDGSLESFEAEEDGDLTTPYHGAGEHVLRDDYRSVDGIMIPHRFTVSRAAGGELFPFFIGEIDAIAFHHDEPVGQNR